MENEVFKQYPELKDKAISYYIEKWNKSYISKNQLRTELGKLYKDKNMFYLIPIIKELIRNKLLGS
jgi:hypothetical protein